LEMTPGQYPAFSDGEAGMKPDKWVMQLANVRIADMKLEADHSAFFDVQGLSGDLYKVALLTFLDGISVPAAPAKSAAHEHEHEHDAHAHTKTGGAAAAAGAGAAVVAHETKAETKVVTAARVMALRDVYELAQVYILRMPAGDFSLALKGGHNMENHNHNDLGSYVVAVGNGTPLLDVGREVYTSKTFSAARYSSHVLGSYGHSVPRPAGQSQLPGRQYEAKVLEVKLADDVDRVSLDLRAGYDVKSMTTLTRTFEFHRGTTPHILVRDDVVFSSPQTFGSALMTFGPFKLNVGNIIELGEAPSVAHVTVTATAEGAAVELKPFAAEHLKEKLRVNRVPIRVALDYVKPVTTATLIVRIDPVLGGAPAVCA